MNCNLFASICFFACYMLARKHGSAITSVYLVVGSINLLAFLLYFAEFMEQRRAEDKKCQT
jgi:hypothetical protein